MSCDPFSLIGAASNLQTAMGFPTPMAPLPTVNGGTGVALPTSSITNGSFFIGNGVTQSFDLATLTAGSGINLLYSPGGITIAASGSYSFATTTTDATPTLLASFAVGMGGHVAATFNYKIRAVRTGGSSGVGSVWNTAVFERTVHLASDGTTARIVLTQSDLTSMEDQTWGGLGLLVVGNNIHLLCGGAVGMDITWQGSLQTDMTEI